MDSGTFFYGVLHKTGVLFVYYYLGVSYGTTKLKSGFNFSNILPK